jgi:hypothetical protein
MLCLCAGLMIWRIAQGSAGHAVYPALMVVIFGSLLILNRARAAFAEVG